MNTYRPVSQIFLRKFRRLFAAAALLFSIVTCSGNDELPAAEPEPAKLTRLDRCHRYLSDRVLRLAESINNVISSNFRQEEDQESELTRRFYGNLLTAYQVEGSHIHVTPRLVVTDGADNKYKLDFSARLRLPDLSKRLRLYADSYDTDYDTMEEIFSLRYREQLESERSEGATAGLTYLFSDHMKRQVSLSTGLRFRPEPSPKIRLRGRWRKTFDIWTAEFSESGFWSERDGFGEKTEFAMDRPYGEMHFLRLQSSVVWSEISHGVDWGQFASYNAKFSPSRSAALKLGVRGYSHPSWIADQYLVRVAYRKRVHRDWLFLEIEPGLDFFREDDFEATALVNLRLEIVLGSYKQLPH